jgi:hypothetical protein
MVVKWNWDVRCKMYDVGYGKDNGLRLRRFDNHQNEFGWTPIGHQKRSGE